MGHTCTHPHHIQRTGARVLLVFLAIPHERLMAPIYTITSTYQVRGSGEQVLINAGWRCCGGTGAVAQSMLLLLLIRG